MGNRYIPDADLQKIFAHLNGPARRACECLLWTGFRVDDVLYMRIRNVKPGGITLRERKTGNVRTVLLEGEQLERIRAAGGSRHPNSYLFRTLQPRSDRRRRKMHRSTLWRFWHRAVRLAGLDGKGYTLHSLRKCYAVNLYRRLGDINAVQADLGHSSIATTLLYALSDQLSEAAPQARPLS